MRDRTEEIFGPVVASYTRAMAIEDGVLVDLMQPSTVELVQEAGFKWPVAITATAFAKTVCEIDGPQQLSGQSLPGRLWDVLNLTRYAIRASVDPCFARFKVNVLNDGRPEVVRLWVKSGAGDKGEPVITIMLEGED